MVVEIVLRMMRWQPDQEPAPGARSGRTFLLCDAERCRKKEGGDAYSTASGGRLVDNIHRAYQRGDFCSHLAAGMVSPSAR